MDVLDEKDVEDHKELLKLCEELAKDLDHLDMGYGKKEWVIATARELVDFWADRFYNGPDDREPWF